MNAESSIVQVEFMLSVEDTELGIEKFQLSIPKFIIHTKARRAVQKKKAKKMALIAGQYK